MSGISRAGLIVAVVALLVGASLVAAGVAIGGTDGAPMQRTAGDQRYRGQTVTVSASGQAEAQPDKAVVRLAIEATADDPTVARQRVAQNATSMREALVGIGVDRDAIRTTGFNIYEDQVRPREPEGRPRTTYRARHSFVVEVSRTDRVGEVIDTAIDNGATSVHGVRFTLSEETRRELRDDAIDEAMSDARAQADAMAAAGGLTVTGVHSARTGVSRGPRPVAEYAAGGGGDGGTSIEAGDVTVTATVTVTYNASG